MLKSARTHAEKDPEGRMPLMDHLRELRNRLAKGVLGIVVVTIVAAFFYQDIVDFVTRPIMHSVGCTEAFSDLAQREKGECARIVMNGLLSPFSLAIKVSLMAGVIGSSPIWLYQLWGFIAPGLHRNEKKYAFGFVGAGVPLFLVGAFLAYRTLPTMAKVLLDFTPTNAENQLPLDDLLNLITRMVLVFGASFELPLLLVMLNLTHIITGKRMLSWWRWMIMGITVFAAVATPSTDPVSMLALAGPIWVLYFGATLFALLNDRRRAVNDPYAGLDDDEAAPLDLSPADIGAVERVGSPRALPEQTDRDRVNGYDDVT
ncbi:MULTISPECIES: twin-arginine translocase subunit TatC [Streptomyces]|uniref:Sec-independent protein translocase protein TatC n=1 Tax=Streptomyces evansiae TaxID=3075535 RepID=A0ABU2QU76_9ACTN|nr:MULTISPECIES: twin-arginine translocase subunit TatC [unclassified Streptomyces]EFK98810.1 twin arginine-targeting protein translocase TatC [Streptomyces sp. SPB78]MDT0407987.1 twin-arginine translocase subunit TatC [Streptomyces sp. DSM 41979]MDT0421565.1 twin-arginine translocase subunit TatC [Streptomyces sp. DSM 41859]MYQ56529.1 twin-arginine translocase subunit TatC [Streptomyces sp. SID4926]MYR28671.1 twin-arginine translocase subunit TatC [Streptomyces sp. SID4945]